MPLIIAQNCCCCCSVCICKRGSHFDVLFLAYFYAHKKRKANNWHFAENPQHDKTKEQKNLRSTKSHRKEILIETQPSWNENNSRK